MVEAVRNSGHSAERGNILIEALDRRFHLIVATNILLYCDDRELLLALINLRRVLAPGGILLHNETHDAVTRYGEALGMPVIHARLVPLSRTREVYDTAVLHEASREQPQP